MLDYARQRAAEALKISQPAVLATCGPAGIQASQVAYEAVGVSVYIFLPKTSDHLYNLENQSSVMLVSRAWECRGEARILPSLSADLHLDLICSPDPDRHVDDWHVLICIEPDRINIIRGFGWGSLETIDLKDDPLG